LLPHWSPLITPRVLRDAAPQPPAVGGSFLHRGLHLVPAPLPSPDIAPPLDHLHKLPPLVPHQLPSTSTWMGHSGDPSALSPPPRALQPLRGPHRPPHRLPRPVVHLYCRCCPLLTHTTMDGLTDEHPSSLLSPIGFPSHCVALAVAPDPPHRRGSPETGPRHRLWPWSCLPCLY
jgi:hypothetical protein